MPSKLKFQYRSDMELLEEVIPQQFDECFGNGTTMYDRTDFADLNSHKVKAVHHLTMRDSKLRFGIILGDDGETLSSPFSAPFGGLIPAKNNRHTEPRQVLMALEALKAYGKERQKQVRITLPPPFYAPGLVSEQANAMFLIGKLSAMDLNYHFPIEKMRNYVSCLPSPANARNYRRALKYEFEYESAFALENRSLFERAYNVIRQNRDDMGFPLRMTAEDMLRTAPIAQTFCVVQSLNGEDITAAIAHTAVKKGIWQVVYWGDLRQHAKMHPMNVLAPELFRLAREYGARIVDIGPSSQHSIPNYGLCSFKLSLGCEESLKLSFIL